MLFNSLSFAVFFPVVFLIYWIIPHKYRWVVLLVASYWFYMSWKSEFSILILISTGINYFCSQKIHLINMKKKQPSMKKMYLLLSIIINLSLLFFFKYFNFFSESVTLLLKLIAIPISTPTLNVLLPVGISFYTFQALSYTIDVYRGEIVPEKHFGHFALYISFFPQLVAGPIERPSSLLPQFKRKLDFNYEKASYGVKLITWGLFKKVVIADNLSAFVSRAYSDVNAFTGFATVIATVFFAFQIYCDFSGYSDIAIGTANMLGIDLMKNFDAPYFSKSIKEFWGKWHISLSTWFRDYVYIPLGGNKVTKFRHYYNLFITFLISGLWHGASWNFVAWGAFHGAALVIEDIINKHKGKPKKKSTIRLTIKTIAIFAIVCLSWILFRANNIGDAAFLVANIFNGIIEPVSYLRQGISQFNFSMFNIFTIVFSLGLLLAFDFISLKKDVISSISKLSTVIKWPIYYLFVFSIVILGNYGQNQFIYFQF